MRALFIIASILAAILLLLFAKLHISLSQNGSTALSIRYLFFRFSLYPRKPRKPSKKGKKKKRRSAKTAAAAKHKAESKTAKGKSKPKRRLTLGDIRFLLRLLRELVGSLLSKASRHVRITLKELRIRIGGEQDAARAAIEYGLVAQSASYLLAYLDHTGFLKPPRNGAIDLEVDFTEREHALSARIDLSCPLIFLIPLLFSALMQALKAKARWSRHRAGAATAKHTATSQPKENENG